MATETSKDKRYLEKIEEYFLDKRQLFIWGGIDEKMAERVIKSILYLQSLDAEQPITAWIHSGGGVVTAGMAIYDTLRSVQCPIQTRCLGLAASMAAVLLAAGTKGHRTSTPHARILIHQPLMPGRFIGVASEIQIQAEEMLRMQAWVNEVLSFLSGQDLEKVQLDTDRDNYMTAKEAMDYGLIDTIDNLKDTPVIDLAAVQPLETLS